MGKIALTAAALSRWKLFPVWLRDRPVAVAGDEETRLREQNCLCSTVTVGIRDSRLQSRDRQARLLRPTANTLDIWEAAVEIFRQHHAGGVSVRSLSVKVGNLAPAEEMGQMSLFPEEQKAQRRAMIDQTLDKLRRKYGYFCIRRGITLVDPSLDLDAKGDHIIHPIGFLGTHSG